MYQRILDFWFQQLSPTDWFGNKDLALDEFIRTEFSDIHSQAKYGELWSWRETPLGRLAEILVLDQFSRHLYRGSSGAFLQDVQALTLAQEAVCQHADDKLDVRQKIFLYMPYMHSESSVIHDVAVKLYSQPGLEDNLKYELAHKKIIDQFGRYPHRNQILNRESTAAELDFLQQPNSSF